MCSGILVHTVDDCNITLHLDISSHAGKLVNIFETVLKDTLCHRTGSLCNTEKDCHLWLHIRRKSRIRKCGHLCMVKLSVRNNTDCIIEFLNLASSLNKLGSGSLKMLRDHILDKHISTGCCDSEHKGSRFNLIRDDGVLGLMKLLHTDNTDHIGSCATDISSHTI